MNNKKIILFAIAIFTLIVVFVLAWQNDKKDAMPTVNNSDIEIFSPRPNEIITPGAKITGVVRGNGWTGFEGQVGTVILLDSDGKQLGMGILTATEDWMKLPTPFETAIYFDYPGNGTGQLVFRNENASGEPARDKTFTVPVKLQKSSSQTTTVKVYFSNSVDSNSCEAVFYASRTVPKTEAVAKTALEQLLMGPTALEKSAGFSTSINEGVTLKRIVIENGTAFVDFSEELQKGIAGSCKVIAIRSQITQTLKQFSTVKNVVISIDGKTEDILQP